METDLGELTGFLTRVWRHGQINCTITQSWLVGRLVGGQGANNGNEMARNLVESIIAQS